MPNRFESVQLATFLHTPSSMDALSLWALAFNGSPSAFQTIAPGHTQAQGAADGISTTLVVQAGRADIILQPVASNPPQHPPAAFNDLQGVIVAGLATAKKIIGRLPVGRTACVINGTEIVQSPKDAVAAIVRLIPNLPVVSDAADINYQITVPRISRLSPHRRLVRLCRWQSGQMQTITLSNGQSTVVQQTFAVIFYVDVFGESMENLSESESYASLEEVANDASKIMMGGFGELV